MPSASVALFPPPVVVVPVAVVPVVVVVAVVVVGVDVVVAGVAAVMPHAGLPEQRAMYIATEFASSPLTMFACIGPAGSG